MQVIVEAAMIRVQGLRSKWDSITTACVVQSNYNLDHSKNYHQWQNVANLS